MYSEEAKEKLKNLIVRYLNQNKMSVPECDSISDLMEAVPESSGLTLKLSSDVSKGS